MAVKDIKSQLQANVAFVGNIATDTTTNGNILDNANFDMGLMFIVQSSSYTDGTYNFTIEEGDDAGLADASAVSGDQLIGNLADLEITGASAGGSVLNSIGVFSNKRYVRINIVSTATTSGADIEVIAMQAAEIVPV
jgi:hypothetical protein